MENILFIGNGLNRSEDIGASWSDVLKNVNDNYNEKNLHTLEFERLVFRTLEKEKPVAKEIYRIVKEKIAKSFQNLKIPTETAIHHKFLSLPIQTLITTNYDYTLEFILEGRKAPLHVKRESNTTEIKYSLYRYTTTNDTKIYHIHGEAKKPTTIVLGYEHYVGTVEKLRERINKKKQGETESCIEKILLGKKQGQGHWGELFFTKNIYIVGFGLNESELDIWWLLTYRAMLYHTYKNENKRIVHNKIVYYEIQEITKDKNSEYYQRRQELCNDFQIEYRGIEHTDYRKDYLAMYEEIEKEIRIKEKQAV